MSAQPYNWDDLRYFLAVARHGRLSAAGRELGVNHTTVFRRLLGFEEQLGTRLFDRNASGHQLTAAGEELLEVAERIADEIVGVDRRVRGRDRELRGTIRVTCADASDWLARAFRGFLAEHPGVDLEVVIDNRFLSLHRREADVAVRPGSRPTAPDLIARNVSESRWGVYASADYLAAHKRPRRYRDLARCDLVAGDASLSDLPSTAWLRRHVEGGTVRYRSNTVLGQIRAIAAGAGVGVVPCNLADEEPSLVRLFQPDDLPPIEVWLVYHGDLRQSARVRAFIEYLTENLA